MPGIFGENGYEVVTGYGSEQGFKAMTLPNTNGSQT